MSNPKEYIATVSHDLKTPLSAIKLYAELLEGSAKNLTKDQRELLQKIIEANEKMIALIKRLGEKTS